MHGVKAEMLLFSTILVTLYVQTGTCDPMLRWVTFIVGYIYRGTHLEESIYLFGVSSVQFNVARNVDVRSILRTI